MEEADIKLKFNRNCCLFFLQLARVWGVTLHMLFWGYKDSLGIAIALEHIWTKRTRNIYFIITWNAHHSYPSCENHVLMKACSTPVHFQIDQRKQAITSQRSEHERGVKPCSIEIGQSQMQLQVSRIQLTTLGTRNNNVTTLSQSCSRHLPSRYVNASATDPAIAPDVSIQLWQKNLNCWKRTWWGTMSKMKQENTQACK
jgi:hypothetical protein